MTKIIEDTVLLGLFIQAIVLAVTIIICRLTISELQNIAKEFRKKYEPRKTKKSDH
ncbi:hypothetical protein [Streptococcus moroccensis]|uniref:Uncharacterized protein n=1 Tax=Streptococcus moroccensis TaxID=1451356 RepID=A0ABT9YSD6_9STRE|nr:hypothetical protein [Streptococcus moroccensis]MDQ0222020.1 hypothetical protein [Streptococcus moroccensis]